MLMARPLLRREYDRAGIFREKFVAAWHRTDKIFALVRDPELLAKPIVLRHPFIFYLCHLPAFSWFQICAAILKWKSVHPYYYDMICCAVDVDLATAECLGHPNEPTAW